MMNAPDGSIIVNAALGLNTLQGHYRYLGQRDHESADASKKVHEQLFLRI